MRNWKNLSAILLLDVVLVLVCYLVFAFAVDNPSNAASAVSEEDIAAAEPDTVEQLVIVVVATRIPPTATRTPSPTPTLTVTPSISPTPSRTPTEEPTRAPYVFRTPILVPATIRPTATPTRTRVLTAVPGKRLK